MLQRTVYGNEVVTYQSPLLGGAGVPHAFSTRIGGVSPPPFDTLNLGNPGGSAVQDDAGHLVRNYRRLQETMAPPMPLAAGSSRCMGMRSD